MRNLRDINLIIIFGALGVLNKTYIHLNFEKTYCIK